MDIINNNPYRILGVYSNSPTRERVTNHNRMNAFLKVGRTISFPLDLPSLLPATSRTSETVREANAKLTLPNEQLKYAQFWFIKKTSIDDIAFNNLTAGNMAKAKEIWEKKECASSLQNLTICALIQGDCAKAIDYAQKLYTSYSKEFVEAIIGEQSTISSEEIGFNFLDEICREFKAKELLPYITLDTWKSHVSEASINPLIASLQSAIDAAKATRGKGAVARHQAGTKLMNGTKATIQQLRQILSVSDLRYQMIIDKVSLEILQCGIDYYNDSEDADAAHKAMTLQSYAQSIVVGNMAKDRCKENVDILSNIIKNLPPKEVFAEDKAIKEELLKYHQLSTTISNAITLLNETKPHLMAIKSKLGATNSFYLKVSTTVVNNALGYVIEEVNAAQRNDNDDLFGLRTERDKALAALMKLPIIKSALEAAWNATKIMDSFDMEADFKMNRYNPNRSTLKNLCDQLGVATSTYTPRSSASRPSPSTSRLPTPKPTYTTISNNSSNSDDTNWGCIVMAAIALIIGLISTCS